MIENDALFRMSMRSALDQRDDEVQRNYHNGWVKVESEIFAKLIAIEYERLKLLMNEKDLRSDYRYLRGQRLFYARMMREDPYYESEYMRLCKELEDIKPQYKQFLEKLERINKERYALIEKVRDKKLKPEHKCWLCLRITPQFVLDITHRLIKDEKLAHKIGMEILEMFRDIYLANSTYLSGSSAFALIGGALYILSYLHEAYVTQGQIIALLGIAPQSLRNRIYRVLASKYLPNLSEKWKNRLEEACEKLNVWDYQLRRAIPISIHLRRKEKG